MPGQPGHGLDVEVVGRLVEDDQVVVAEQQPGQRAPSTLAAGEPFDGAVERHAREQHLHDLAGRGVRRPLVLGAPFEDRLAHGRGRVEVVALGEVAEPQAAVAGDPAVVGGLQAGEHPEQGGLAVAVAADDADLVALADAEAHVGQQGSHAVGLVHALQAHQVAGHVSPARWWR